MAIRKKINFTPCSEPLVSKYMSSYHSNWKIMIILWQKQRTNLTEVPWESLLKLILKLCWMEVYVSTKVIYTFKFICRELCLLSLLRALFVHVNNLILSWCNIYFQISNWLCICTWWDMAIFCRFVNENDLYFQVCLLPQTRCSVSYIITSSTVSCYSSGMFFFDLCEFYSIDKYMW